MMRHRNRGHWAKTLGVMLLTAGLAPASPALAESWCASPIEVHEWGVHVLGAAPQTPAPPAHAHDAVEAPTVVHDAVRHMEVDSGMRELPVVHFYASNAWGDQIPFAFEVGFAAGDARRWFPQVDARRPAAEANGEAAKTARTELLAARASRQPYGINPPLGTDPTRQLLWERLTLSSKASNPAPKSTLSWVEAARQLDRALWVNRGAESERFLFYDGATQEQAALVLERGEGWANDRPHYVLKNTSKWAVHDVLVVRREGDQAWVFSAPSIPAGKSAGFLLDMALDTKSDAFTQATRGVLEAALVDASDPIPKDRGWGEECVMMRDPSKPVETASSHTLYRPEATVLLDAWQPAFFEGDGLRVIYREDVELLDSVMPVGAYTDMYHFVQLHRAGLVLWWAPALVGDGPASP